MPKTSITKCTSIECKKIKIGMGKRNFTVSNWCKNCSTWKPKKITFCNCCKQRLRFNARRTPSDREYKRI